MQSDFQRHAEELYQAGVADGFRAGFVNTLKKALEEAALSAAEPVAWLPTRRWERITAAEPWLTNIVYSEDQSASFPCIPLYASPPALSAQVQDVAGWQDISTAPQDGTTFLAIMAKAYSPRATLCKVEDGKFFSPSQGEKFVVPGWNQWWPTHWMPLPAAPSKQEGGDVTSK
ncbi:hypothetical protein CFBP6625_08130 [Agrobacterium tumefaciens]|nr:hypothetical protein CFBP6625_08130 [Agrobacterium tumefaciens]